MVVRIKRKLEYRGTATPSDLNTETDLINLGTFSNPIILEGYIDTSALQSGDAVKLIIYIAVDGTNRRKLDTIEITEPLDNPIVHLLSMTLPADAQPRVTLTQTSGTLRSFPYWFIVQELEEI
ncbi:MAG: hypothetical protein DRO12_06500 [Thermoprotei archaeon]|nr:MAG: hypothetical protein DRO12_06500 [Thermoprotei archaeon]